MFKISFRILFGHVGQKHFKLRETIIDHGIVLFEEAIWHSKEKRLVINIFGFSQQRNQILKEHNKHE